MGVREIQKQERNRAILSAGLDAFVERGYVGTRISDIATRANMSIGLLFHYYDNTEKLYEALVSIGVKGTKQFMPDEVCADPIAFFDSYVRFLLHEVEKNSFTAKMFLLMDLATRSQDTPFAVKAMLDQIKTVEIFSNLIQKGQVQGTIKSGDPVALTNTFLVCLIGLARQIAIDSTTPLPDPSWIVDIIRKRG